MSCSGVNKQWIAVLRGRYMSATINNRCQSQST
jgi:hypothetical protein